MRLSLRHPCILALAALAALTIGPGAAPRARAASMSAPLDYRPKDFTLVKKDGVYHLFYIRHSDFLPPFATEIDFGHAISTDLYNWTQLAPVMGVNPHGWDNLHVWAPHVIAANGLYWMFYAGVTETPDAFADTQRIGLAVSDDLSSWSRVGDQPVWTTESAPWAWWAPRNANMSCRDPFVMPDPAAPGQYLLYYTASPVTDSASTVVGVARSATGALDQWADEKPLWVTYKSYSFNSLTESPHLFQHNGHWFLFMTTNAGQPLSFFVGANPLGEPAEWTYRGRLRNMLGLDTSQWFASEYLRDGTHDLFAYVIGTRVEIREIAWGAGDNFTLADPPLFHVVQMGWTAPEVHEFDFAELRLTTANWFARDRRLVAFVQTAGGEMPAPADSIGLPETPPLASDTSLVAWTPRRWPATLGASTPMKVRVAVDDGTATTPWLTVLPSQRTPGQALRRGGGVQDEPPNEFGPGTAGTPGGSATAPEPSAGLERVAPPSALAARALVRPPLGGGLGVAFALAAPAHARVDVFDLQGRRVVTLADRGFASGAQVVLWDGRDAGGAALPRGLYFARVATPGASAVARLLLER